MLFASVPPPLASQVSMDAERGDPTGGSGLAARNVLELCALELPREACPCPRSAHPPAWLGLVPPTRPDALAASAVPRTWL